MPPVRGALSSTWLHTRRHRRGAVVVVMGVVALAAIAVLGGSLAPSREPSARPLSATELNGQAIYRANCASCHGARGEGQPNWRRTNDDSSLLPPPHDSSGHTWHHSDLLLFQIVRNGGEVYEYPGFKSNMPAWGDTLSDDEIVAVIEYLKTLWAEREREIQAQASVNAPFPCTESRRTC